MGLRLGLLEVSWEGVLLQLTRLYDHIAHPSLHRMKVGVNFRLRNRSVSSLPSSFIILAMFLVTHDCHHT
jgi:hypothetical protein